VHVSAQLESLRSLWSPIESVCQAIVKRVPLGVHDVDWEDWGFRAQQGEPRTIRKECQIREKMCPWHWFKEVWITEEQEGSKEYFAIVSSGGKICCWIEEQAKACG
jgi:hypothetical protein